MFLSQLKLNVRNRQVRFDLARSYEMHRTFWKAFPDDDAGRVMFRVDTDRRGSCPVALVQSDNDPDWSILPEHYLLESPVSKSVGFSVVSKQRLRFRLRANPTKRVAARNQRLGGVMEGKRVGLITEADQFRWLIRKGAKGGFQIPGKWVSATDPLTEEPIEIPNFRVDAIPQGRIENGKPGFEGVFHAVLFEGILEVTEPEAFVNTLANGIGSGKAFGFGLLSVAPV